MPGQGNAWVGGQADEALVDAGKEGNDSTARTRRPYQTELHDHDQPILTKEISLRASKNS